MPRNSTNKSLILKDLELLLDHCSFSNTESSILKYLIEKSLENEEISEYHIAIDVLGKKEDFNPAEDSTIRVNVRRLRLKLKEYYLSDEAGAYSVQFSIPKGQYLIEFSTHHKQRLRKRLLTRISIVSLSVLVIILTSLLYQKYKRPGSESISHQGSSPIPGKNPVWKDFSDNGKPTIIVLGDLYFMRMLEEENMFYVRHKDVNSPEEQYELNDERLRNYSLTYIPANFTNIVLRLYQQIKKPDNTVRVALASEFSLDDIANNNVLYLGNFEAMGDLYKIVKQFNARLINNGAGFLFTETGDTIHISNEETQFQKMHSIVLKNQLENESVCMFIMAYNRLGIEVAVNNFTQTDGLSALEEQWQKDKKSSFNFDLVYEFQGVDSSPIYSEIIYFRQH